MLSTLRSLSSRSVRLNLPRTTCRDFSFTPNYWFPRVSNIHSAKPPPIPTFREQVARSTDVKSFSEQVSRPSIRNQIFFFVFGSFVVYSLAAKQTNSDTAYWSKRLSESGNIIWKLRAPTSDEMRRSRYLDLTRHLQAGLQSLKETVQEWPHTIRDTVVWAYVQLAEPILQTTDGRRICWTIGAFNGLIWLAWQFPRMQPLMRRSFTHNPLSGLSYTMLTSTFSHKSILHYIFNSMALASFGSAACQYLMRGQDQSPTGLREATVQWHFLAFFISAGLFSGLVSHVASAWIRYPQLVAQLLRQSSAATHSTTKASLTAASGATAKEATSSILPSLGASGAIYAAVTLTALAFPDTEIALLFPPTFPIPIQWGVGSLVALDIIGAIRGWRLFDHWAHLGGAAFGVGYYYYGLQMWDVFRLVNLGLPVEKSKKEV